MGLGNPGPDYQDTRHNAGFWFVDRWAGILGLSFRKPWFRPFSFATAEKQGHRLVLVKPLTFMNHSGLVLPELFARFGASPADLMVVFDQMDLPPGRIRMKPHGTAAGHNGLKSIDEIVTDGQYHRVAVGIGRPAPGVGVIEHVLGTPTGEARSAVEAVFDRVVPAVNELWSGGWEPLIHAVNQRDPSS